MTTVAISTVLDFIIFEISVQCVRLADYTRRAVCVCLSDAPVEKRVAVATTTTTVIANETPNLGEAEFLR